MLRSTPALSGPLRHSYSCSEVSLYLPLRQPPFPQLYHRPFSARPSSVSWWRPSMDASAVSLLIFAGCSPSESSGIESPSLSGKHLRVLVGNRLVRFERALAWGPRYDRAGDLPKAQSRHSLHSYITLGTRDTGRKRSE
jgi:hypothetical protein